MTLFVFIICLGLFSFRTLSNRHIEVTVLQNKDVTVSEFANFVESYKTFPDKFTAWRKNWTLTDDFNHSAEELKSMLDRF